MNTSKRTAQKYKSTLPACKVHPHDYTVILKQTNYIYLASVCAF